MKCFYSVPEEASGSIREACDSYAHALREWNKEVSTSADQLGTFVESTSGGRLCIDDEDWNSLRELMTVREVDLPLAEIFWKPDDARRIADTIESLGPEATSRGKSLQAWLQAASEAGSSIVTLTK